MCGIFLKLFKKLYAENKYLELKENDPQLFHCLKCRGPDSQSKSEIQIVSAESETVVYSKLEICASVLWMQGKIIENQPIMSNSGDFLLFNGDLFDTDWIKNSADSTALFTRLQNTNGECGNSGIKNVIATLKSLNGPFALMYFDSHNKKLYFCRDSIGRRSLLIYKNENELILSSILSRKYKNAIELPSRKIYCMCLKDNTICEFPWNSHLEELNSVSIDSWYKTLEEEQTEIDDNIHLNNIISEENMELIKFLKDVTAVSSPPNELFKTILENESIVEIVNTIQEYLSNSVRTRVRTQPGFCQKCITSKVKCDQHSTVGILFSGGLDCTILAALAHRHLPSNESIDLLNVAFTKTGEFNTPDRITSKQSYEKLRQLFPQRQWNLVEIDVTLEELYTAQKEEIADLIFPLQTILDESLGSALWFAARGKSAEYTSTCRIVLTGIGADELFGGYTRHRNAFKRGGWTKLQAELQMDWQRIATRNLARDDRVISHHGRQPRMPYLDEKFVKYVLDLEPWQKCFPDEKCGPGIGDKLYLRLVAFGLGLAQTSTFPKRAIQFGSKIANKKENAKDVSQRLTSK